jgi:hypothetical protein
MISRWKQDGKRARVCATNKVRHDALRRRLALVVAEGGGPLGKKEPKEPLIAIELVAPHVKRIVFCKV